MYKSLYLATLFLSFSNISFASDLSILREEVSIYSPNRLNFNNTIQTILLKNVETGPQDQHFSLTNKIANIKKGMMSFDDKTIWRENKIEYCNYNCKIEPYNYNIQSFIKDRISNYGIARLTFDSYQDCINLFPLFSRVDRFNIMFKLHKLRVLLDSDDQFYTLNNPLEENIYYKRSNKVNEKNRIKLCRHSIQRSFDIVAHEVGHSILDTLQPNYINEDLLSHSALHESFGDLSIIFASVRLAKETNRKNLLPEFIHSFNSYCCIIKEWRGPQTCLRDHVKYNNKSYDRSTYFTNFYIQMIKKVYINLDQTSENALWTLDLFQYLLIKTVVNNSSFADFYNFGERLLQQIPNKGSNELETLHFKLIKNIILVELNLKKEGLQT